MLNTTANLAAKYWADKLRKAPTPDEQIEHARLHEDPAHAAFMHFAMPTDVAPADKLPAFELELAGLIISEFAVEAQIGRDRVKISVDYDPCRLLTQAAERAGFKLTKYMLPWKHRMWVYPTHVEVCEGYAKGYRRL